MMALVRKVEDEGQKTFKAFEAHREKMFELKKKRILKLMGGNVVRDPGLMVMKRCGVVDKYYKSRSRWQYTRRQAVAAEAAAAVEDAAGVEAAADVVEVGASAADVVEVGASS